MQASLTFDALPSKAEIEQKALALVSLAKENNAQAVMIGGVPFFMATLEKALKEAGLTVLYAFSVRESVDEHQPDGTVVKHAVFKHAGFVEV